MGLFGRRKTKPDLAEAVLDQQRREAMGKLAYATDAYLRLITQLDAAVKPGQERPSRADLRAIIGQHKAIAEVLLRPGIIHIPAQFTSADFERFRELWRKDVEGDSPSPTVVG